MSGPRDVEQGPVRAVLPVAGGLERWPDVATGQARAMLDTALSGLGLGRVDRDVRDRLSGLCPVGLDPVAAAAVVASWVRRGFEAGLAAGRGAVLEEAAAVRAAQTDTLAAAAAVEERYGRVVVDVVTAAREAELVVEDDTADTRVALRALLARIERAVAGVAR